VLVGTCVLVNIYSSPETPPSVFQQILSCQPPGVTVLGLSALSMLLVR